jgi:hypothetical protein
MKTLILLTIGAIAGAGVMWISFYIQQFGNTAYSQWIRSEMDKRREEEKKSLHAQGAEGSRSDGSVKESEPSSQS